MDSVDTVNPKIDYGPTKFRNTDPKCGRFFGSSCMRECVKSPNQNNCLSCEKQLTDNETKSITFQDRIVTISKKTTKFLCQATLTLAPPVALPAVAGFVIGATGSAAVGVAGAGLVAGPAFTAFAGMGIGMFWASVGGERATSGVDTGVAKGVAAGVATSVCMGAAGAVGLATMSAIGSTVEAVGNYFIKNDD